MEVRNFYKYKHIYKQFFENCYSIKILYAKSIATSSMYCTYTSIINIHMYTPYNIVKKTKISNIENIFICGPATQ